MNWEVILIILIPLVVWILGAIFRGAEDQTPPVRPTRPRPDEDGARLPRRQTELDRFLEEARRRRTPDAPRLPEPEESPTLEPVKPRPERRREQRSPRREARPPRPQPAEPAPAVRSLESLLPQQLVVSQPPLPPVAEPVVAAVRPAKTEPAPAPAARPVKGPVGAVPNRVREMLQDRDATAMALVLCEILGPPLCKRQR